jgi:hypothetical protein
MMDSITEFFDKLLALVLAASHALRRRRCVHASTARTKSPARQTIIEVIGGTITANMLSPLVQDVTPDRWHYTLFFLVGWGGLELVGRLYEVTAKALEARIARKLGGE